MTTRNSKSQAAVIALTNLLGWSGQVICVVSLAFLFVALTVNVVLRYAFGSGLSWAYDVHVIVFPWMIAGGVVLATTRGGHIAITILRDALNLPPARMLYILVCFIVMVIAVAVLWSSIPVLRASQFQKIQALGGVSQFWGYLSLMYAFGGIALASLLDIFTVISTGTNVSRDLALEPAQEGR